MDVRARLSAAFISVTAAIALAGCGSPVHLTGRVPPPPGHQAPANAVSGFAQHLLAGNNPIATCGYVDPEERGNCYDTLGTSHSGGTGTWRLGHIAESGNEAIVGIEYDHVCLSSCVTNVSPDAGLPRPGVPFGTAYQATQDGSKDYALACIRRGDLWYVELSISGLI